MLSILPKFYHFNPRSPHGERQAHRRKKRVCNQFQSTLPARGATASVESFTVFIIFQSTLPARGATFHTLSPSSLPPYFNPRSPHGERRFFRAADPAPGTFQSTLPARGATARQASPAQRSAISIHAPRTGSDRRSTSGAPAAGDFNPRSPHGERQAGRRLCVR